MRDIMLFGRVGGETIPASLRKKHDILTLRMGPGRKPDFNTWVDSFGRLLGPKWDAVSFDLLNVMCALRSADRYFTDQGLFQARRRIRLAVGVTDVARWRRIAGLLSRAVAALSGDILEFHPLSLGTNPKLSIAGGGLPELEFKGGDRPDCVCLFSGGADSFAGAAYLLSQGRRPLFVSHAVGPVSGLQKRLFDSLVKRFKQILPGSLVQVRPQPNTVQARRRGGGKRLYWRQRDGLQRLRSAFFFSMAAIVARAFDLDEIFMCENGLIGSAIVFAPIDDTPYTTRPAEPRFLRAMEGFLREALEAPSLSIRNPFQYMTKGQVLRVAARLGFAEQLHQTVSCWRSGNRGVRNCGQCVPCMFRQLAFSEAGLPPPPKSYGYRVPIPQKNWRRWNSIEVRRLEDIRQYCRRVLQGGTRFLLANELAVVDAIDVTGGPVRRGNYRGHGDRDSTAPLMTARTIRKFAEATLRRLP